MLLWANVDERDKISRVIRASRDASDDVSDGKETDFMELEKQIQIIDAIRTHLDGLVGQRLSVRANMGRSKIIESEGVLVQIHPQLFIMEVEHRRGRKARQSYQYVDILTGTVELSQDGESLFAALISELAQDPEEQKEPILSVAEN